MRRRMIGIAAVLVATFLPACFSVGPQEAAAIRYHEIALPAPSPAAAPLGPSLVLRPFSQDAALDREEIRYLTSPTTGSYFAEDLWVQSVASMVRGALQADLAAWGGLSPVLLLDHAQAADLVLVGEVHRFEEVDRGGAWTVVAEMTLEIMSAKTGGIVYHRRHRAEEPCEANDAASVVRALSRATARIAAELREGIPAAVGR